MNKYLLIFLLLASSISHALTNVNFDSLQWHLKKNHEGIEVSTSEATDSGLLSAYGKMTLDTSLNSLVALLIDANACKEWAYLCKHSHIHKTVSDTEFYLYTATNPAWPVKNRDILVHVNIEQEENDLSVTVTARATAEIYPEQENYLRITDATSVWKFIPLDDGKIQVETYSHVNPAGAIPHWMHNLLAAETPYTSLKDMRTLIQTGKYDNAKLPYIKEPLK